MKIITTLPAIDDYESELAFATNQHAFPQLGLIVLHAYLSGASLALDQPKLAKKILRTVDPTILKTAQLSIGRTPPPIPADQQLDYTILKACLFDPLTETSMATYAKYSILAAIDTTTHTPIISE